MPLSIREQLLQRFNARLATLSDVTVYRNRRKKIGAASFPALNQIDGGEPAPDDSETFAERGSLEVEIEGHVGDKADAPMSEAELGPALSDLYARVHYAVMADRTLGGLAIDIHRGALNTELDRGEGKAPEMMFSLGYTIDYWTHQDDPYTAGP